MFSVCSLYRSVDSDEKQAVEIGKVKSLSCCTVVSISVKLLPGKVFKKTKLIFFSVLSCINKLQELVIVIEPA